MAAALLLTYFLCTWSYFNDYPLQRLAEVLAVHLVLLLFGLLLLSSPQEPSSPGTHHGDKKLAHVLPFH